MIENTLESFSWIWLIVLRVEMRIRTTSNHMWYEEEWKGEFLVLEYLINIQNFPEMVHSSSRADEREWRGYENEEKNLVSVDHIAKSHFFVSIFLENNWIWTRRDWTELLYSYDI